jgi:release factor glutamine methyltransferase
VTAIDISKDALAIAKENSVQEDTGINFVQLDFLNESKWQILPSFDVIVSNPPYIPENEKQLLDKNVAAFEPGLALFVEDNDPLIFYKKIAAFGKKNLKEGGEIFMEVHQNFAHETAALFNDEYYSSEIKKDINGNERMLIVNHRSQ